MDNSEKCLAELLYLLEQNKNLSYEDLIEQNPYLVRRLTKSHGSIFEAAQKLGPLGQWFAATVPTRKTKILAKLRKHIDDQSYKTQNELRGRHKSLVLSAEQEFDSLQAALNVLGEPYRSLRYESAEEKCLKKLRDALSERTFYRPIEFQKEFKSLSQNCVRYFGSLEDALNHVGFSKDSPECFAPKCVQELIQVIIDNRCASVEEIEFAAPGLTHAASRFVDLASLIDRYAQHARLSVVSRGTFRDRQYRPKAAQIVKSSIAKLREQQIPLNQYVIKENPDLGELFEFAIEVYGTWKKCLTEMSFPPAEIRYAIEKPDFEKIAALAKEEQVRANVKNLVHLGNSHYGSLPKLLSELGQKNHVLSRYWLQTVESLANQLIEIPLEMRFSQDKWVPEKMLAEDCKLYCGSLRNAVLFATPVATSLDQRKKLKA